MSTWSLSDLGGQRGGSLRSRDSRLAWTTEWDLISKTENQECASWGLLASIAGQQQPGQGFLMTDNLSHGR